VAAFIKSRTCEILTPISGYCPFQILGPLKILFNVSLIKDL